MRYLDSVALVRTLPCIAAPGRIIVIGRPSRSLDEVIPYLATLPGVIAYNPGQLTLTFRRPAGFMTLEPGSVYITQVRDVPEGLDLLEALKDSVNAVWEGRAELAAVTAPKRTPRPLDVWSLLPQTNCRSCGEATCLAFAVALLQEKRKLTECPVLQVDAHLAERRVTLQTLLG